MTDISALNRALIVAAEAIISPRSLSATVRTLFVACYLGATPDHGVTWSPPPHKSGNDYLLLLYFATTHPRTKNLNKLSLSIACLVAIYFRHLPNMYVCTYMLHTKQQIIFEMY
jgi:hypothetical protein